MSATTHPTLGTLGTKASERAAESPARVVARRFMRHRLAMVSVFVIAALFALSLFAAQVTPYSPNALAVGDYLLRPGTVDDKTGLTHYLGTDHIGRDTYTRLVYAGRISLTVALTSTLLAVALGMTVGVYAGYYGGWVDSVLMRAVEFLATIPALPLLLVISAMLLRSEEAIPIPEAVLQFMGKVMLLSPRDARQAVIIINHHRAGGAGLAERRAPDARPGAGAEVADVRGSGPVAGRLG
jgi:peptide/nickel transport system permease protein